MHTEDVLLRIRLRGGLPVAVLRPQELARAEGVVVDGLLVREEDRLVLTDRGRLLADGVVRRLLD
jgi:oxygen-independent coproporphyrinogen-3 oxidase